MATTLITAFLPFAIKIITAYLEKGEDKKEARELFLKFIEKMNNNAGNSTSLRTSYQAQIDRLRGSNAP